MSDERMRTATDYNRCIFTIERLLENLNGVQTGQYQKAAYILEDYETLGDHIQSFIMAKSPRSLNRFDPGD